MKKWHDLDALMAFVKEKIEDGRLQVKYNNGTNDPELAVRFLYVCYVAKAWNSNGDAHIETPEGMQVCVGTRDDFYWKLRKFAESRKSTN